MCKKSQWDKNQGDNKKTTFPVPLVFLNIKKTRAYLLTRQMSENGLIDIIGRGAAKKYKLSTNQKM